MVRRRVSGCSQTGGKPGAGGALAGGDAIGEASATGAWESGVLGGEAEGVGKGQGGASLPEGEAGVQLQESTLPGLGQEHALSGVAAGTGHPDDSQVSTGCLRG